VAVAALPPEALRAAHAARRTGARRALVVSAALGAATVLAACVSLSVGDFPVPLGDVVAALAGAGSADAELVVLELRLPRVVCGLVVGAAFGLSGAVFQAVARNPLASPDIIGITAGASAAAVLLIVLGGAAQATLGLGALAGGVATALAISVLAWRRGLTPYRLVLVGIGLSAVLAALTSYLLTRAEITDVQRATVWLTGSLNGRGWEQAAPAAVALAVLAPAVLLGARALRALQLGDDAAAAVGVPVGPARAALLLAAVALAAMATAAAGPVAFVAFVAAPIARRLVRTSLTLVPAAFAGALLVVLADLVARRAFAPTELPVGVLTGLVGAPYLLWLLARAGRLGSAG